MALPPRRIRTLPPFAIYVPFFPEPRLLIIPPVPPPRDPFTLAFIARFFACLEAQLTAVSPVKPRRSVLPADDVPLAHPLAHPALQAPPAIEALPALQAPPAIEALPADLLSFILAFIALRPRLRIASLVCRCWRSAAVRSVTSVGCCMSPKVNRTVALFPALQDLCLVNNTGPHGVAIDPVVVPTTCTSLRTAEILHSYSWPLPQGLIAFATPAAPLHLRHLTLAYATFSKSAAVLFTSSLTSLTLRECVHLSAELGVCLAALHLPSLTTISINLLGDHTGVPECVFSFMANHASQLKSLTLARLHAPQKLLGNPLPALTHLSVTELPSDVFSRLLRECTNLTTLEQPGWTSSQFSPSPRFICDVVSPLSLLAPLTSFAASHHSDACSMEALAKCRLHAPRLTRVQMHSLQDVATVLKHNIGELLTHVTLSPQLSDLHVSVRDVCDLLDATPNLESLFLPGISGDASCCLTRPLPKLTQMRVQGADVGGAALFYSWLWHIVSYFPNLHSLTFPVIPIKSLGDFDQPIAFIKLLSHSTAISHLSIINQTLPDDLPPNADFAVPLCEFVAGARCEWFAYLHCEHLEDYLLEKEHQARRCPAKPAASAPIFC